MMQDVVLSAKVPGVLAERIDQLCEEYNWNRSGLIRSALQKIADEMAPQPDTRTFDGAVIDIALDILRGKYATVKDLAAGLEENGA